jgi:osmoprotectant transport system ATP-binding protein
MLAEKAAWAVVIGADGGLRGWVSMSDTGSVTGGEGTVAGRARRLAAFVEMGADLKEALSTMLRHDAGWVGVESAGRFVGVLTPDTLHAALRRSVRAESASGAEVA